MRRDALRVNRADLNMQSGMQRMSCGILAEPGRGHEMRQLQWWNVERIRRFVRRLSPRPLSKWKRMRRVPRGLFPGKSWRRFMRAVRSRQVCSPPWRQGMCVQCHTHSGTIGRGAASAAACICNEGFRLREGVCEPCFENALCANGTIKTKPGFQLRGDNRRVPCDDPSVCLLDDKCLNLNRGPLCAACAGRILHAHWVRHLHRLL